MGSASPSAEKILGNLAEQSPARPAPWIWAPVFGWPRPRAKHQGLNLMGDGLNEMLNLQLIGRLVAWKSYSE